MTRDEEGLQNAMQSKERNWLVFRVVLLFIAVIQAWTLPTTFGEGFSESNWGFVLLIAGFVAFGVVFVLSIQSKNPWSPPRWQRPSWTSNPFNPKQPLYQFHLASYYFLVLGAAGAIAGLSLEPKNYAWQLVLSVGLGTWIGTRLSLGIFRDRLENEV